MKKSKLYQRKIHESKVNVLFQEYLRQQQEERARDPVNMTASRDRFPPAPGYNNKGVPSTKQGDTYRGLCFSIFL